MTTICRYRLHLIVALAGACAADPPPASVHPVRVEPPARTEPAEGGEPKQARPVAESAPALSREDCDAFEAAPALAVAVVVTSEPDCSSVGHTRTVLEVRSLGRGAGIERVGTSRTLYSNEEPRLQVGDTALVAIEPRLSPAETVHCVALPERQGSVRHAVKVDSLATSQALLDAVVQGKCGGKR
jgi:hypothetical protein